MSTIDESVDLEIHSPSLRRFANTLVSGIALRAEKIALNHRDPSGFPLEHERGDALSVTLERMFDRLPSEKRDQAHFAAIARLSESPRVRARKFGALGDVDLRSPAPVANEVAVRLQSPPSRLGMAELTAEMEATFRRQATPPLSGPQRVLTSTSLRRINAQARAGRASEAAGFEIGHRDESGEGLVALRTSVEVNNAIDFKYDSLGSESGVLGAEVSRGLGFRRYDRGIICWVGTDADGSSEHGERLGTSTVDRPASPTDPSVPIVVGAGEMVSTPSLTAEVHGLIYGRYEALGGMVGPLGKPLTDELTTPDGVGRYNHFEAGSIYWTPQTGAREVLGAIRDKWEELGWEQGLLGYPITGEVRTPDGAGFYQHFQRGSIYWHPQTGAHEVHGQIRDYWEGQGWERGPLGYPVSDEATTADGEGRYSLFQGGQIRWYADHGAYTPMPDVTGIQLRCVTLHCIEEQDWYYEPGISESDEIRMIGTLFEIKPELEALPQSQIESFGALNSTKFGPVWLEDDWDTGDWNLWKSPRVMVSAPLSQQEIGWPKAFIAICVLVEEDTEGDYSDDLDEIVKEIRPVIEKYLEEEMMKVGVGIGGLAGLAFGYVAGKVAAYVFGEAVNIIAGLWHDDPFPAKSLSIQIPGPGAVFQNGKLSSESTTFNVEKYGARYRYRLDWHLVQGGS